MISYNQCILVGNVGREPELQTASDGTSYTRFSLAVDEYAGKDEEGKAKDQAMWITIVAWRNLAGQVEKLVKKGSLVLVSGKLSIRKYTDKNDQEKTAVEVVARTVQLLEPKAKQQNEAEPEEEE